MRFTNGQLLPDEALVIPLRRDRHVVVIGVPHDLTRQEADKIVRIVRAHAPVSMSRREAKDV